MAFASGRVSFVRLRVESNNELPLAADQTLLDKLAEREFTETSFGAPDEVEVGWIAGDHVFDTQFSYEKNAFGDMLLVSMRMDTNKVPADVKRAYKIMNEQTLAAGNPSGFASKNQKREAADLASRQVHEDLASGKYRRSKTVPILWDLRRGWVYCGTTSNTVVEHLSSLFRKTFEATLAPVTAGSLAGSWLIAKGNSRDFEDIRPSAFTAPPPQARRDEDEFEATSDLKTPFVPWATAGVDAKDFLGNEFLIWLWHLQETNEGMVETPNPSAPGNSSKDEFAFVLTKTVDMQCAWDATGRMNLRSDGPTRLPEAAEALAKGKWPRKTGFILVDLQDRDRQFEFTFQADQLQINGLSLPLIEDVETQREMIERRLVAIRSLTDSMDAIYQVFMNERLSSSWRGKREAIKEWIKIRTRPVKPQVVEVEPVVVEVAAPSEESSGANEEHDATEELIADTPQ